MGRFRNPTSTYQMALRHDCPTCGAKPGYTCQPVGTDDPAFAAEMRGRRYNSPKHHQERRKAYQSWRRARGWR